MLKIAAIVPFCQDPGKCYPQKCVFLRIRENLARETTSLVRLARAKNAAARAAIWLRQLPPSAKSGARGIEPTI